VGECPFAREQVGAGWNRRERTAISSVKDDAYLGKPVQVGSSDFRVAIAAKVVTAQSVRDDDDDVEWTMVLPHENIASSFATDPNRIKV
jgi:hypothetical protein